MKTKEVTSTENKLRLLMIYAVTHPEKFDATKQLQWRQLAQLSVDDMSAVKNMEYLGISVSKKHGSGFSLKFGNRKKNSALRKERDDGEKAWELSRFYPVIEELIENLAKGELSRDEYPFVKDPGSTFQASWADIPSSINNSRPAHSRRTSRATSTWARPRQSDDGYSSESILRHATSDPKILGQRIFVFIIGGATRSELRTVHKLTEQLKREVVLGSTSVDDPHQFITKLKLLGDVENLSVDDLHI